MIIAKSAAVAPYTTSSSAATATFLAASGQPGAGLPITVNLPGSGRFDGKSFAIQASGSVQLAAGTYTATVQPLIFASKTPGFTPGVANAIYSVTGSSVVVSSATPVTIDYTVWADLIGSNASGKLGGVVGGVVNNGAVALAPITNSPTSVNYNAEPPLQFSAGVTFSNAVGGVTLTLSQLNILAD